MAGKIVNLLTIGLWLVGIFIWIPIYQETAEVYVRKSFHLSAIMTIAASLVLFSSRFDGEIKGLGTYVKVFGVLLLLIIIFLARTIITTNGL